MADSLSLAVFGAFTATAGYFGKLIVEAYVKWSDRRAERRAALIEMQSYLLASRSVYETQIKLARHLCRAIEGADPSLSSFGYDEILARGFKQDLLSEALKNQHGLIRAYTEKALLPLNKDMLAWLRKDRYFKNQSDELGAALRKLEAHLVLWMAKYEFWLPDRPERALVFLADELDHGVGFPKGIEAMVLRRTGGLVQER
jgi:hypothetical protein